MSFGFMGCRPEETWTPVARPRTVDGDTTYPVDAVSGETVGVKVRLKTAGTIRLDRLSTDQIIADAWWAGG